MKQKPPSRLIDITGKRYGFLTVLKQEKSVNGATRWLCRCDCGNEKIIYKSSLTSGETVSCGCWNKIKRIKHNSTNTRLFRIWSDMKNRCYNKNNTSYKHYGERGIYVCDLWKDDFACFKNWALKNGYKENLTIERKNVNGNYCPENCSWITKYEQRLNKRGTIKYKGEPLLLICKRLGLKYKTIWARIKRGKSVEEAIAKPLLWAEMSETDKQYIAEYRLYLKDYTDGDNWWEQNPLTYEEWLVAHHPVSEE